MVTADVISKAQALASLGLFVFPVYVKPDPENPYRTTKRPGTPNGFYDATNDPFYVMDLFDRHDNAEVGVWMGPSGLVAADIDVKRAPDGTVEVDGWESLDLSWEELPDTFSFDSVSGAGGKQFIYLAPEGLNLGPAGPYRKIQGVDRRAGDSYSVWAGDVPDSRDAFKPAPEWLLDERTVRSAASFEGTVKEWFETLEPGEPSLIVRAAIERAQKQYAEAGNDFSHGDIVERQMEAVRLGSEGHPGVPELLAVLEELTMSREGSHSRPEDEWEYEFQEALASGVQKYGDAIELRKNLTPYSISIVPNSVPDHLVAGEPGDKAVFRELLARMVKATEDDMLVLSVLWDCPRTRDISREWGLQFVHERILSARERPEPVRENPTIPELPEPTPDPQPVVVKTDGGFLSEGERELTKAKTPIDRYLDYSAQKGFSVPAYDIPGAWTALSMVMGTKAVLSYNGLGTNLWFIEMGGTGTGKSTSQKFLTAVLNNAVRDEVGHYNVGASSSPAAIHEELLLRDDLASILHHDEAASFFTDLSNTEWMRSLEHHFSKFYDGEVEPSNKIRLPKELRGKRARTSFGLNMSATPEKLLRLITTSMFESGFLSRVNWTWAPERADSAERFQVRPSKVDAKARTHPAVFEIAADLKHAAFIHEENLVVGASDEAWDRLSQAATDFDAASRSLENYEVIRGPLTRLTETMVKCAALLALYRGDENFDLLDVLQAIKYAEEWYATMIRVVNETSESEFSRDMNEIEAFIRAQGGAVTEAKLNNRFRTMIRRSPRELEDRIAFLRSSGRVNREEHNGAIKYVING